MFFEFSEEQLGPYIVHRMTHNYIFQVVENQVRKKTALLIVMDPKFVRNDHSFKELL